ncbi:putative Ig domain-containing protein [bacterium]|nr:putative Ig domain-containing protein [bacterium]
MHTHTTSLFSFVLSFVLLLLTGATAAAQSTVEVTPEVSTVSPGSTVTINIKVNNVSDLHTVVVGVAFDKNIVSFVGTSVGSFLKSNEQGYSVFYYEKLMPTTDPDSIRVDQAILGKAAVEGSGEVFSVTFKALREGTSAIRVQNIELRNSPNYIIDASPLHGTIVVGESSNRSPEITSEPEDRAVVGEQYSYRIQAQDPDGDQLEYSLIEGPAFLSFDAASGTISGTPAATGRHDVVMRASDGKGGTATQSFKLAVFHTTHPPTIPVQISPANGIRLDSIGVTLHWSTCTDDNPTDIVTYIVRLKSSNMDTVITGLPTNELVLDSDVFEFSRLYTWTVSATDGYDTVSTQASYTFRTPSPTPVEDLSSSLPADVELHQNFPNPFRSKTQINFSLQHSAVARLEVFDLSGRRLATLTHASFMQGAHRVEWDGRDDQGKAVPAGTYLAVLTTPHVQKTVSMLLLH